MNDDREHYASYSERYRRQREADTETPAVAPYATWYAERFQQRPNGTPSRQSWHDPSHPAAEARLQESIGHTEDTGASNSGYATIDTHGLVKDCEGATPFAASVAEPTKRAEAKTSSAAPDPAQLRPRGARLALSANVERQLQRNARELGMIGGNIAASSSFNVQVLTITSGLDAEGKTTAALNTAYGLASGGAGRVLLVDANPANPRLHTFFGCSPEPGLCEVLAGETPVENALYPTTHNGLEILPAGGAWFGLGSNIPLSRMEAFIALVRSVYDYVVIDGTSVFSSSDATRLAPLTDGVMLVVSCEQTKWEVGQSADEKIRSAGSRTLGVVLNRRRYYIPAPIYNWLSR